MDKGRHVEWFGGEMDSVELLNMDGTLNCPMPPMPEPRVGHTQTGLVACGNMWPDTRKSCVTFSSGGDDWVASHNLTRIRRLHSAWDSPQGIMLLGGGFSGSGKTTEILLENGETTPGFNLVYEGPPHGDDIE